MIDYHGEEPTTTEDKKYRAESDARTLAEADVINKDEDRLKMAGEAAKKMAEQAQEEAHSMRNVADKLYPEK